MVTLTNEDKTRYNRQMMLSGWGETGQARLKAATAFIAGAGGLGSPVAIYLAVAGVGHIKLCDADRLELSNLNRQVLHPQARVDRLKAESAAETLQALNPAIEVVAQAKYLDEHNINQLVARPDIIVDCLDNYETRYLLNDYSIRHGIPLVHGAVWGLSGQLSFLHPPHTPCLKCIVPEPPPKEIFPVLGATPGVVGTIQAMEALKYLAGVGTTLQGRLLLFEGEEMEFMPVQVERRPGCPACGHIASPR